MNQILTNHGDLIIGRLGLPYGDHGLHVISLIVDGEKEQLQGLCGVDRSTRHYCQIDDEPGLPRVGRRPGRKTTWWWHASAAKGTRER